MSYLTQNHRVAILLHKGIQGENGKTGLSFLRYSDVPVVAVIDFDCAGKSLETLTGIPQNAPIVASVGEALTYNPDVLLIGIAPSGGKLPPEWLEEVKKAILAGLSVVNGLHTPLAGMFDTLQERQWIWDIRQEPQGLGVGTGKARSLSCRRILTVGTDMAVGKMSASLELYRAAQRRGVRAEFVATGQGGLMIVGQGIPLDSIRVDFAAGAVEKTVMELGQNCDLLIVEGQGALFHPGSTATLPLIRGTQPTELILAHRAGQKHIRNLPHVPIPPLAEVVQLYESVTMAGGAFEAVRVSAIALNTFHLSQEEALEAIEQVKQETGLPCSDVVRFGGESLEIV